MPYKNPEDKKKQLKRWHQEHPGYDGAGYWERTGMKKAPPREKQIKTPEFHRKRYYDGKKTGLTQARTRVKHSVNMGRLIHLKKEYVKCFYCNNRALVYDHRDYNFPLEVQPVCYKCNVRLGKAVPLKN